MLYAFREGSTPLLVDVPHAGTRVPDELERRFTPAAAALPDTDWHVDRLVESAPALGAGLMVATHSRYAIDLNRGLDDVPLYDRPTTGLVPTETFDGQPVYADRTPGDAEIAARIERFWRPYHARLADVLSAIRDRHGHAVLLDVHSIRSRIPRLFDGRLPDLNLGTHEGASCAPALKRLALETLSTFEDFSLVADGRFTGGHITRHYGRPDSGVHALQIEIAQACYMDENRPEDWNDERAQPLREVLAALIARLVAWRPA